MLMRNVQAGFFDYKESVCEFFYLLKGDQL